MNIVLVDINIKFCYLYVILMCNFLSVTVTPTSNHSASLPRSDSSRVHGDVSYFSKIIFSGNTIRVSNSLDPDQD